MDLCADLADALVTQDGVAHGQGFVRVQGHRLLQVDVLARLDGQDGHQGVPVRRRGDDDGIDVGPGQQIAKIAISFGAGLVPCHHGLPAALSHVAHGRDHDVGIPGAVRQVALAHAVDPDDAQPNAGSLGGALSSLPRAAAETIREAETEAAVEDRRN